MEKPGNLVEITANVAVEFLKKEYEKKPFADFVEFKIFGTQDFRMTWKTRIAVFAIDTFLDSALREAKGSSLTFDGFGPEHRLIDMMVSICASDGMIQNQFLGWIPLVFQDKPFLSADEVKAFSGDEFTFHGLQFTEKPYPLEEKLKIWNLMTQQAYQPSYFYQVKLIAEHAKK